MSSFILCAKREDLPTETMCNVVCSAENLEREKTFIRKRIAQENRKFSKGVNPWKLHVEQVTE